MKNKGSSNEEGVVYRRRSFLHASDTRIARSLHRPIGIRLTIISLSFIVMSLMFVGQSSARIDLETCVGMWLLDEGQGNVAKDSSGNGNDGELMNGPKWVSGKFGTALEFDGKEDYVACGNGASLDITTTITVMGWVNPDQALGLDGWQRFASRGEYNTGWMIGITNAGKPDLTVTNAGGGFVTMYGKTTLELGKWYHIAGVVDSSTRQVYIYFNVPLDNNPMAHSGEMMNPGVPTTIGKSGVAHVYDFHGVIDEVVLFLEESAHYRPLLLRWKKKTFKPS